MLSRRHRADLADLDLARDHLMSEPSDDLRQELETVASLVSNQNAKVLDTVLREASSRFNLEMPADGAEPLKRKVSRRDVRARAPDTPPRLQRVNETWGRGVGKPSGGASRDTSLTLQGRARFES